MADKLVVVRDSGGCELGTLKPYPAVLAGSNTTVNTSTNASGQVTYTVNASGGTDSYVTGISIDNTTGQVVLTRNNGLPNLTAAITPNPVVVAGANVTVTPTTGANGVITYTVAASGGGSSAPDSYVTGITIDGNGLVTLTRNNGLPNLTAQIQFPTVTEQPVPGLGARMGSTIITTSGQYATFDEYVSPMGGMTGSTGDSSFQIPFTGWYSISNRATMRKTQASVPTATVRVVKNGTPLATLGINFGNNYFPNMAIDEQNEVEKEMLHLLNAGDIIAVESYNFAPGSEWIGETLNIRWHSAA